MMGVTFYRYSSRSRSARASRASETVIPSSIKIRAITCAPGLKKPKAASSNSVAPLL
jgi:hypothetical protein